MLGHIGRLQGYIANQLVKRKEETRQRCSVFPRFIESSSAGGNLRWLYGKSGDIGIVLQENHSAMARDFYLQTERIADGYEGGPIFFNKADTVLKFPDRGEINGKCDGWGEVQKLLELFASQEITHLFKAWESPDSLNPLDLLVFSKASPDSKIYVPSAHLVTMLED